MVLIPKDQNKKELDANNEKGRKQDENEYKKRMELEWHEETAQWLPCTNQFTRFPSLSSLYLYLSLFFSEQSGGNIPRHHIPRLKRFFWSQSQTKREHATSLHACWRWVAVRLCVGRVCFRKTSAFHDIPRQLHSNVMKEQQDGEGQPTSAHTHTHNILRINWPVLLTCRNDGNAKVYVYNTNTMKKSNITRALFQFRFLLEYMDGWIYIPSEGTKRKRDAANGPKSYGRKCLCWSPTQSPFCIQRVQAPRYGFPVTSISIGSFTYVARPTVFVIREKTDRCTVGWRKRNPKFVARTPEPVRQSDSFSSSCGILFFFGYTPLNIRLIEILLQYQPNFKINPRSNFSLYFIIFAECVWEGGNERRTIMSSVFFFFVLFSSPSNQRERNNRNNKP